MLFILGVSILIGFTLLTTKGQVKPNLLIANIDNQLVIRHQSQRPSYSGSNLLLSSPLTFRDDVIDYIIIDGVRYQTQPYWLKRDLQGTKGLEAFREFYQGEAILRRAVMTPSQVVTSSGQSYPLTFSPLTWQDYDKVFILSRLSAAIMIFFSLWVYAIAPKQRGAKVAVLGSYCFAIAFLVADSSIPRLWAMNPKILRFNVSLSEVMTVLYSFSIFYLVWYLPRPLIRHRLAFIAPLTVLIIPMTLVILSHLHIINDLLLSFEGPYFIIHIIVLLILVYRFGYYFVHRRRDILEWITIRWVMLATVFGITIPLLSHILVFIGYFEEMPYFALDSIIIFKMGLSALVASSVLYQAESIWWRLWVVLIGGSSYFLSYLVQIMVFGATHTPALIGASAIALSSAWLTQYLLKKRYTLNTAKAVEEILPKLLVTDETHTASAYHGSQSHAHSSWGEALAHIFKPLSLTYLPLNGLDSGAPTHDQPLLTFPSYPTYPINDKDSIPAQLDTQRDGSMAFLTKKRSTTAEQTHHKTACLKQGGACLEVIDINGSHLIQMIGANKGLRLFTKRDVQLIRAFWAVMQQQRQTQRAFIQGEAYERQRIAADLHDDIGGKLLYLASEQSDIGRYAHETLQDLRILARGLSSNGKTINYLLADLNYQMAQRCEIKGVTFELTYDLVVDEADTPSSSKTTVNSIANHQLTSRCATTLTSIFNELIRNALAHDGVSQIKCRCYLNQDQFVIEVSNDGITVDRDAWKSGFGIASIKRRVHDWQGSVYWHAIHTGGVSCDIRIPLRSWYINHPP